MNFILYIFSGAVSIFLLLSAIAFLKAKNLFMMNHVAIVFSIYLMPAALLMLGFERFSAASFAKILAIILLDILVANLVCYLIIKRATADKIKPDADFKKTIN